MNTSKEFQLEYTVHLPVPLHGNFNIYGDPFDREDLLSRIAHHAAQLTGTPVDWTQTFGLTYTISETTRLLDSPWDSHHGSEATAEEMLKLLASGTTEISKIEKLREMHRQNDG